MGSLAEGPGQRGDGRAQAAGVDAAGPPACSGLPDHPGRWLAAGSWPAAQVQARDFHLGPRSAAAGRWAPHGAAQPAGGDAGEAELRIRGGQAPAADLGQWGGHGGPTDFPGDQRPEDGLSLSFDTGPLAEPVEILGFPVARLELAADRPLALVAVRLCDVWPDGASTLITRGLKNLTHRDSDADPAAARARRALPVEVTLNSIGYQVPAGHRLRLSVSPTYWPWAWPSPEERDAEPVHRRLAAHPPALDRRAASTSRRRISPTPSAAPCPRTSRLGGGSAREVRRDVATGTVTVISTADEGHRLRGDGPGVPRARTGCAADHRRRAAVGHGGVRAGPSPWGAGTGGSRSGPPARCRPRPRAFQVTNVLDAYEGDRRVFTKTWHTDVPRDCAVTRLARRHGGHERPGDRRPADVHQAALRRGPRGGRRQLRHRAGRDRRAGGRVGLRQDDDRPVGHAPAAATAATSPRARSASAARTWPRSARPGCAGSAATRSASCSRTR